MSQGSEYTRRFQATAPIPPPAPLKIQSVAQLLSLVDRASSARLREPDLAKNLYIADIINEKKGVYPREVAMHLAKLANSWSVQNALLALSILDVCVKNCGYPFHLAISRRDFLNLLVKGFPERPPLRYTQVQMLILQMLEEWNLTIAKVGRYRDDMSSIRDMHRLLAMKGYMFPEANQAELAALMPPSNDLKSAEELEQEDREAQSAKLQELIRSGTAEDLKEANRLMSVMSGFRDTSEEYKAREALEIQNLEEKLKLAEEMRAVNSTGDVLEELEQVLNRSVPKLQSMEPPRMDLVQRISNLGKQVDLLNLGDSDSQPKQDVLLDGITTGTDFNTVYDQDGVKIKYTARAIENGVVFEFHYSKPLEMEFAPAKNLVLELDPLVDLTQLVKLTGRNNNLKLRWRAVGRGDGVIVYN